MPDIALATKPTNSKPDSLSNFDSFRETVESIAVAFMLAFIFKTFLVEAFVIPTGSMAPTLQGKHQDLACPQCGHQYRTGAGDGPPAGAPRCPNCEYRLSAEQNLAAPVYSGDRILVNKFLYDFDEPQRWDVIVFKFPEDAKTNYIKRLIGLPGEQLSIRDGDIYTTKLVNGQPSGNEEIARKPNHKKLVAMLQEVYANDDLHEGFVKQGWPLRWNDWSPPGRTPAWKPANGGRDYVLAESPTDDAWIRYQHFVPTVNDWADYLSPAPQPFGVVRPVPIKDDYAYNSRDLDGKHWVGDLAVEAEIATNGADGVVTLELIKGGVKFQAQLDLQNGSARLAIPTLPSFQPAAAPLGWKGSGKHIILFANVDHQLTLLVDGQPVFDTALTRYEDLNNNTIVEVLPERGVNEPTDFSPAGIAIRGTSATVKHLRILRDVYYIDPEELIRARAVPDEQKFKTPIRLLDSKENDDLDQFLMLGDNSPRSSDSRYWTKQSYVERRQLIGKAIYIFWPHAWDFDWSFNVPLGPLSFKFPFYPNFKRMTLIR